MFRLAQRPSAAARSLLSSAYSTASPQKIPLALVAELRKQTAVSISKAREALTHSNGSIPGALEWLQQDLVATGTAKAAKVSSRATNQGLVGVSVLSHGAGLNTVGGVRAAMIELNCETDFVGRNDLFAKLAMDVVHTAAYISEATDKGPHFASLSLEQLQEAPLLLHNDPSAAPTGTVSTAIRDTIVKVGENITLRRASAIVEDAPLAPKADSARRLGSYVHGALHGLSCGRVASLALLNICSPYLAKFLRDESARTQLGLLERSIARQIVGFDTLSIKNRAENMSEEQVLYTQPFITLAGEFNGLPVEEALKKWSVSNGLVGEGGIEVLDFLKWSVGETEQS
ncbi:hypothetical protein BDN70DRAFT_870001 [Pholiota conissans]|uniref:Elongation factor Ts, mitochondrial n=1 Tax=Pholiota conissans TaxID=109636 RepID=A0A9P6CZI8_9AGAR|nr:hypothetical protein BDN70DRAFT_870001 [Pholiota conissans]